MNLIELISQVCDELAITRPINVVASVDPQVRQLYALVNRLGSDLSRQWEWQQLDKEHIITTVAQNQVCTTTQGSAIVTLPSTAGLSALYGLNGLGITPFTQIKTVDSPTKITMTMPALESGSNTLTLSQIAYPLPSDWQSQVPQTEWDRTNRWPLMGPVSSQDWQSFKSGIVYAGPRQRFRILGDAIVVNPPPPNGLLFSFEYISNAWVNSVDGVARKKFEADTDSCIFSDSLMITGLKAQWKASKGLDGTFDLSEFQGLLDIEKAQDKSAPVLSLSPINSSVLLSNANVQDGNWHS